MHLKILNENAIINDPIFGSITYDSQISKRFNKKIILEKYSITNLIKQRSEINKELAEYYSK